MSHDIIVKNEYCNWFSKGELNLEEVKYFTVQFSVFSNLFLIAQLKKMINAVDLDEMRNSKEILANELGCIFKRTVAAKDREVEKQKEHPEEEGDLKYVNTQGTVDGGTFKFKAAHFEWLLDFGKPLGLEFSDLGKRSFGTTSTLIFCDELDRLYGSENHIISAGASFAVENWAAAGFWKDLKKGLYTFKKNCIPHLHLGFFTWHDKVEDQHREDTFEELRDLYFGPHAFDEDLFISSGIKMLDGVSEFWQGLNRDRLEKEKLLV